MCSQFTQRLTEHSHSVMFLQARYNYLLNTFNSLKLLLEN